MKEGRVALVVGTLALTLAVLSALQILPTVNVFRAPIRAETLIIEDATGQERITLTTRPNAAPAISLLDNTGMVRMELSISPSGSPGISLISPAGKSRLTASLRAPDNGPELTLYSQDGALKWRVWLDQAGEPKIVEGDL